MTSMSFTGTAVQTSIKYSCYISQHQVQGLLPFWQPVMSKPIDGDQSQQ